MRGDNEHMSLREVKAIYAMQYAPKFFALVSGISSLRRCLHYKISGYVKLVSLFKFLQIWSSFVKSLCSVARSLQKKTLQKKTHAAQLHLPKSVALPMVPPSLRSQARSNVRLYIILPPAATPVLRPPATAGPVVAVVSATAVVAAARASAAVAGGVVVFALDDNVVSVIAVVVSDEEGE